MVQRQEIKLKIPGLLRGIYPQDLLIGEVANKLGMVRSTASSWLRVLMAEGKMEVSRKVENPFIDLRRVMVNV